MHERRRRLGIQVLGCVALLGLAPALGCEREAPEPPAAPAPAAPRTSGRPSPAALQEAATFFATECSSCHGANGAGNGPRSREFTPLPRNFQDPDWQQDMTDAYLREVLVKGGAALDKSDQMPAYPVLAERPELLAALVAHMRHFAR